MTMFVGFVNGYLGEYMTEKNAYWQSLLHIIYLGLFIRKENIHKLAPILLVFVNRVGTT